MDPVDLDPSEGRVNLQFVFLRNFISSKTLTLPSDGLVSLSSLSSVDGTYFVLILFGSEVYLIFFVMCLCKL